MRSATRTIDSDPISAWSWFVYFLRNGWVRFKATFGLPIDVDKNFYAADAAWRLKRGLLPKGVKFTVAGRSDGGGMQALSRISGLNFAAAFGATYVHSPFVFVEHGQDGDVEARAWEAFLNIGEGELAIKDFEGEVVDYSDYFLGRAKLGERTVLRFQQCYWPGKQNPATLYSIIPRLRQKLRFEPRQPNSDPLRVAIHVRRGDVSAAVNNQRFTDNAKIAAAVKQVIGALNVCDLPFQLTVHSQGEAKGFAQFVDIGCELSLNANTLWTLRQLMEADILVMSKSSFSYTAALVNSGVKLYEPWLQAPLPDWIVRHRDGGFDERKFRDRLGAMINGDDPGATARAEPASQTDLRDGRPALSGGGGE